MMWSGKRRKLRIEFRIVELKGQVEYWVMEMGRCGQEENQERFIIVKGQILRFKEFNIEKLGIKRKVDLVMMLLVVRMRLYQYKLDC